MRNFFFSKAATIASKVAFRALDQNGDGVLNGQEGLNYSKTFKYIIKKPKINSNFFNI